MSKFIFIKVSFSLSLSTLFETENGFGIEPKDDSALIQNK